MAVLYTVIKKMSNHTIVIIRNAASSDFGGGERFPVFLSQALEAKGCTPVIISASRKLLAFADELSVRAIKGWWWSWQNWNGKNSLLVPLYGVWQLILLVYYLQLFVRLKPTVVHIQSRDDFIAATYAAKTVGARIIWTDHADLKHVWNNLTVWYKNPVGKMVYLAAHMTDAITVVSKSELSLVTMQLPSQSTVLSKVSVVYNGVPDTYSQFDHTKNPVFTYLVASRLVTDKGIREAISAFKKLHDEYPETRLQIIGDGPEASMFKQQAASTRSIQLLGHQSQPLSYMASADIFIQATYHEGFSVALVEASMMKLAIIATNVGGNTEIIRNQTTGILVPAKDINALYTAMKLLFNNTELRNSLSVQARKQYEDLFVFDTIVTERFMKLYEETTD